MRTMEIYINDQFYKTIEVQDDLYGRYNPIEIITMLNEDREKGLLDQFNINENFSIKIQLKNY